MRWFLRKVSRFGEPDLKQTFYDPHTQNYPCCNKSENLASLPALTHTDSLRMEPPCTESVHTSKCRMLATGNAGRLMPSWEHLFGQHHTGCWARGNSGKLIQIPARLFWGPEPPPLLHFWGGWFVATQKALKPAASGPCASTYCFIVLWDGGIHDFLHIVGWEPELLLAPVVSSPPGREQGKQADLGSLRVVNTA